jgi:magnesium transporter
MRIRIREPFYDDPVTHHVRRDLVRLRIGQTVGEALAAMREQPPQGRIIYFYVVDSDGRLEGVVPTRRLLLSPLETPVADIMVRQVIALPVDATVLDACEFFILHRLLAFPVVDKERRLIGVIDVDLYTERLNHAGGDQDDTDVRGSDDLFQLIGVHVARARQTSPLAAFRGRFPWLLCNLTGGLLAALLSWVFEAELQRVVALALFIPVVLALAESVSTQSVSLALQVLHGRPATWRALLPWLGQELLTGFLLGGACGVLVGGIAWVWLGQHAVAWSLLGGAAGGVAGAAVLGIAVPNLLRLLALDPHVAGGPLALALSDLLTLLIYFNLAHWLLARGC